MQGGLVQTLELSHGRVVGRARCAAPARNARVAVDGFLAAFRRNRARRPTAARPRPAPARAARSRAAAGRGGAHPAAPALQAAQDPVRIDLAQPADALARRVHGHLAVAQPDLRRAHLHAARRASGARPGASLPP